MMVNFQFSRTARLLKPQQFGEVFKHSIKSIDASFVVLGKQQQTEGSARLGLAIAKKRVKRAVDRNLIKRIIRESFRLHKQQLEGFDFVVLVQKNIQLSDKQLLSHALSKHWQRILKRSTSSK